MAVFLKFECADPAENSKPVAILAGEITGLHPYTFRDIQKPEKEGDEPTVTEVNGILLMTAKTPFFVKGTFEEVLEKIESFYRCDP